VITMERRTNGIEPRSERGPADHHATFDYAEDLADRIERAHRARAGNSELATDRFLGDVATGLDARSDWTSQEDDDDPDEPAEDAERAGGVGDTEATIDFVGRAIARHGRRTIRASAEAGAPNVGPLTLFFVEPGTLVANELLSEAAGIPASSVLPADRPLPRGLSPIAGYLTERPDGFDPADRSKYDYISTCFMESMGIRDTAYAGLGVTGARTVAKPRVGVGGAGLTTHTSVSSVFFRRVFPQRLPFRLWAPTFGNLAATTASVGGLLGRWVPYVGWALLASDVVRFGACLQDARHGTKRPARQRGW